MSEKQKFHTDVSVRAKMEELQKTFEARRASAESELAEGGVDEIIPILKRCYPLEGLRITGRDIDDSLIKLNVTVEYFRTELSIYKSNLATNACKLMENVLLNHELYKAATENINILNKFMSQFDTPDRTIRYTIDNNNFPVAEISDKALTFAIDVENAVYIGDFAFAKKLTMGDEYPPVLDIEYDEEVLEAKKFFTPESIFKTASVYNRINRELGVRVMYSPSTIIKKLYFVKTAKRVDGYTFKDNVYTVTQDGVDILTYALTEAEIKRRNKPFGGVPKDANKSKK